MYFADAVAVAVVVDGSPTADLAASFVVVADVDGSLAALLAVGNFVNVESSVLYDFAVDETAAEPVEEHLKACCIEQSLDLSFRTQYCR